MVISGPESSDELPVCFSVRLFFVVAVCRREGKRGGLCRKGKGYKSRLSGPLSVRVRSGLQQWKQRA